MSSDLGLLALPTDWRFARVAELVERPEYGLTSSAVEEPVGPKLLRITDISGGTVNWKTVPFCRCPKKLLPRYLLSRGDLLVARIGATTGRTYLVQQAPEAVFASYLIRLRVSSGVIPEFLAHFCASDLYWQQIEANKGGKLKGGISIPVLLGLHLPLPPDPEQRAIDFVLKNIHEAIEVEAKRVAALKELKAATAERFFSQGLNGAATVSSEIGAIPAGWQLRRVEDLGDIVTGSTPPTAEPQLYGGETPFISPSDLGELRWIRRTEKTLSDAGALRSRRLPPGTVLVVCIGSTIGKVGMTTADASVTNQQINAIKCGAGFDPTFVHYLMRWNLDSVRSHSSPSPVPILTKGAFSKILIAVPSTVEEQQEIGEGLASLDDVLENAYMRVAALDSLFRSTLNLLMTAAVRLTSSFESAGAPRA